MVDDSDNRPSNKVARLIEEYDLDGLGDELESLWTAERNERMSLRALAQFFNKRTLEQALLDAGVSTVEMDLDQVYRRLAGDDVSAGVQTETRNRLERNGVDIEKLERDFVSYQAIRSYLTEWRDASYETLSDEEKIGKDLESIQRLLTRTESVAGDRIEKLRDTGRIEADDFEILLSMQVLCQRCGNQYPVATFLEQGGCECMQDEDAE
jgi:hypothetical protein